MCFTDDLDETRARVQKSADEANLLKSKLTEVQKHAEEKSEMVIDLQGKHLFTTNYLPAFFFFNQTIISVFRNSMLNLRKNIHWEFNY